MNSFQSLLNSYSHLRKRTYSFNVIETQEIGSRATIREIPKEILNVIQPAFNRIGEYSHITTQLIAAFQQKIPFEQKTDSDLVWVSEDGTKFSFRGDDPAATSSLPIEYLEYIILYLQEGGDVLTDPKDAVESEVYPPTPQEQQGAANTRKIEEQIDNMVQADDSQIPNLEFGDLNSTTASLQLYSKDNPLYTPVSTFQLLLHAITDSSQFSEEETQEAVLELQEDTITLLDFLKNNKEALDSGECIPPSPEISKLRERFFISQLKPGNKRCLSYGNLKGDSTTPSKMGSLMNRLKESRNSEATQEAWAKSKTGKEKPGRISSEKIAGDPSNAVAISAQVSNSKGPKSSSYIFQLVDKYKNVKICAEEGDKPMDLFEVDSPQIATQLTSTMSEKTSVLVDVWRRRGLVPEGPQRDKIDAQFAKGIVDLQNASERDCEQLKDLVAVAGKFKNTTGSFPPGTPAGIAEMENMFETLGVDNDVCGMGDDFKTTFMAMMKREAGSTVQQTLSNMSLEGNAEITDVHPDGRTVNQIVGRKGPGEGVYPVDHTTRCVADNLIVFDNLNDVLNFYKELGINPDSKNAQIALNNPVNGKYIIPISDKFYTEAGWTSQGKMEKLGAYKDEALIDDNINSTFGNSPNKEEYRKEIHKEREVYLNNFNQSVLQLVSPDILPDIGATQEEIDKAKDFDRNNLDEFIKAEILSLPPNNKDRIELEDLQEEIKAYDKLSSSDPTSPDSTTQRSNLAHKLADIKRKAERRNMTDRNRRRSLAAAEQLNRLACTGSANAILNTKDWSTIEAKHITEDDIRELNGVLFEETWNGTDIYSSEIKSALKGGTRRTNRPSGAIEVALTASIHTLKANLILEKLRSV